MLDGVHLGDRNTRELALVQQVLVSTVRAVKSNGITVETNFGDPPPFVMADPVQLQQVLLNLVTNAIDAMSGSGHKPRLLQIETCIDQAADEAVITVADTGPGFDAEVAEQIFKPFFTTKSSGMGLGLSICQTIVEAHKGRLTAASRDPRGAVFRIVLPRHWHE